MTERELTWEESRSCVWMDWDEVEGRKEETHNESAVPRSPLAPWAAGRELSRASPQSAMAGQPSTLSWIPNLAGIDTPLSTTRGLGGHTEPEEEA